MPFNVPGIGYAGLGNQTAAAQLTFRKAMGGTTPRKTKRRRPRSFRATEGRRRIPSGRLGARSDRARGQRKTTGRRRKSRLVKGSAAAKRYMARIRRMRKR